MERRWTGCRRSSEVCSGRTHGDESTVGEGQEQREETVDDAENPRGSPQGYGNEVQESTSGRGCRVPANSCVNAQARKTNRRKRRRRRRRRSQKYHHQQLFPSQIERFSTSETLHQRTSSSATE